MTQQLVSNGGKNEQDGRISVGCESWKVEGAPRYRLDLGDNT